jgi:glutathione S-transferase
MEEKLELISFDLCPYVQRSVINLLYKEVDFKRTNIDLKNKPEWFLKLSPMGKVPVLKVGEEVLFESAVINEYLDEITGGLLLSRDPLMKAKQRAWIEFAGELNGLSKKAVESSSLDILEDNLKQIFEKLERVESVHSGTDYFSDSGFSLVDTSYAPFFMRLSLIPKIDEDSRWGEIPKVKNWKKNLMDLDCVKKSVPENFVEISKKRYKDNGSVLFD